MHESAKANGRVPLPHIPVSYTDTTHLASCQHRQLYSCGSKGGMKPDDLN